MASGRPPEGHYENEDAIVQAARALRAVHDALAGYPDELPSYKSKIRECEAQLRDPDDLLAISEEDRGFLIDAYERLTGSLAKLDVSLAPIHGDAHLGNFFFTPSGPLWSDFEAVSIGPREWDASGVPYLLAFEPIDHQVYALMLDLRSMCVSAGRWRLIQKNARLRSII